MRQYTITVETSRGQIDVSVTESTWRSRPIRFIRLPGWAHGDVDSEEPRED